MYRYRYTALGLVAAIIFWFLDSAIHWLVCTEPGFQVLPPDENELWM